MSNSMLVRLKAMYADAHYGIEATGGPDQRAEIAALDKTFADLKALVSTTSDPEELERLRGFVKHFERHGQSDRGPEETRKWAHEVLTRSR